MYEQTHPFRMGKIAALFPDLSILVVHMVGAGSPDLSNATIEIAQAHSNLTLIGSETRSFPVLTPLRVGARDQASWTHVRATTPCHRRLDTE